MLHKSVRFQGSSSNPQDQPIIDQHVIRSFGIYKSISDDDITNYRKLGVIVKKNKDIISQYIDWLKSDEINTDLKQCDDYTYYIDRVLFALGRKVKKSKAKS